MSANLTELDIVNKALLRLAANVVESPDGRVSTITTESLEAKLCIANYPIIRDIVTEDRIWSFALQKVILDSPDSVKPVFGLGNRFAIPTDALNIWRASRNPDFGFNNGNPSRNTFNDAWLKNGQFIETDLDVIYVIYIKSLTDATILDATPQFVDALSLRLAIEFCMPLTENKDMQTMLIQEYQARLVDASSIDGAQATHEVIRANSLSKVRI